MSQEVYELEKGLERIENKIIDIKRYRFRPIIIGIAGGSGSGKTTKVAQEIEKMFPGSKILSMDDYIRGKDFMRSIDSHNWDEPRVYDFDLLQQDLDDLKQGKSIRKPDFSFTEGRRLGYKFFGSHDIVILEGLFALYPGIVEKLDLKIFVDVSVHGSLIRRILRDVERTGQTEKQILNQYVTTVYPMFKLHVEPTKNSADIVIKNQYIPKVEANNCGACEIQIKVPLYDTYGNTLINLGFKEIAEVNQEDTYYSDPNWPNKYGDEIMRIRQENDKCFLSYKGPEEDGVVRIKPKKEFEIDFCQKKALKELGYKEITTLKKRRKKFVGHDLEVNIDYFDNGCWFMEFCSADPIEGERKIKLFLEKLGLDKSQKIKESYLDIMLYT